MPPTLGQRLQQAREHRGLSLPDVAHQTRIPIHRLRELEEDNYNALGSVTYAKGHLRAYAALLGVEADDVLDQMKAPPLGGVRNYRYLVESYGPLKTDGQMERPMPDRSSVASAKSPIVTATISAFFVMLVGGVLLGNAFLGEHKGSPSPAMPASAPGSYTQEARDGFSLYEARLEVEPEVEVRIAAPAVTPPKALPVIDEEPKSRRKLPDAPKALPVE